MKRCIRKTKKLQLQDPFNIVPRAVDENYKNFTDFDWQSTALSWFSIYLPDESHLRLETFVWVISPRFSHLEDFPVERRVGRQLLTWRTLIWASISHRPTVPDNLVQIWMTLWVMEHYNLEHYNLEHYNLEHNWKISKNISREHYCEDDWRFTQWRQKFDHYHGVPWARAWTRLRFDNLS